jgi:hypothetical protein
MKKERLFAVVMLGLAGLLSAQEPVAPPRDIDEGEANFGRPMEPATWEVVWEVFSIPLGEAARFRRKQLGPEEVYDELVKGGMNQSTLLEDHVVMKTLVGASTENSSVEELIYPTEYDPPNSPFAIGDRLPDKEPYGLKSPAFPSDFGVRGLGLNLKLQMIEGESPDSAWLKMTADRVMLDGLDTWGKGLAEAKIPRFRVQGLRQKHLVRDGQRVLLGSMSPPRIEGKVDRRVWLAFAKAKAVFEDEKEAKSGDRMWTVEPRVSFPLNATCEVFSLGLSEAAKLKRDEKSDSEIYAHLVKSKSVDLEEFVTFQMADEEAATLKSIREMRYAHSFDPPDMPNSVQDLSSHPEVMKKMVLPANPTSFGTAEIGSGIQLGFGLISSGRFKVECDLKFLRYLERDRWGVGPAEVEMPRFASQHLNSQIEADLNSPTLLGSISPPAVLQPKVGERRVWWAFLTVSEESE